MPKRVVDGTYFFFYTLYCVFFKNSDSNSGLLDASKNGRNNCFLKSSFFSGKRVLRMNFGQLLGRTRERTRTHLLTSQLQDNAVGKPAIVLELVMSLALVMKKVLVDNLSRALEVLNANNFFYLCTFDI